MPVLAAPRYVLVAVTEAGRRVGESNPKARLSNAEVDHLRELHEDYGLTYHEIAVRLKLSWHTVRSICGYRSRSITPDRVKRINLIGQRASA